MRIFELIGLTITDDGVEETFVSTFQEESLAIAAEKLNKAGFTPYQIKEIFLRNTDQLIEIIKEIEREPS